MNNAQDRDIATVLHHYLVCALWATPTGDSDDGLDDRGHTPESVEEDARTSSREDIVKFLKLCDENNVDLGDWSDPQLGHDLFLTRNGHGAGFWDRGLEAGEAASVWARTLGEVNFYDNDTGTVSL